MSNISILASLRALAASAAGLAQTRIELFGVELQDEIGKLALILAGALVAALLLVLGLAFAGWAAVMAFEPPARPAAAAGVALVYIGFALLVALLIRRWRAKPRAFDATLTELERDYMALKERL